MRLALTTNIDTVDVPGHKVDTVVGLQSTAAASTFQTGDTVNGNGLTKVSLTVTGDGDAAPTGSIVDLNNIASVNINLAQNQATLGHAAGINALEYNGVAQIAVTNGVSGNGLIVNNAQLETTFALAKAGRVNTLTVASITDDLSGKADVINFAANGTGTEATNSTIGTAVAGIESTTLATTGVNYVTVNSSADTKAITITGNGTSEITIGTANGTLLVDASATTGDNLIDMVNHLSGISDTVKGGSGQDVVVANIANTTQATITDVETLDLSFTAGALFNASKVTGVDTLYVANTGAATFSGLASTVETVVFDTTAAGAGATLGFASGTATTLEVDVGLVTELGTSTAAVGVGGLTVSGNAGTINLHSLSDKATTTNSTGALNVGTATALNIDAESAALTVGALTGSKLTTLDVEATAAGVTVAGFDAATALTTLTANATKGSVTLGTVKADNSLTSIALSAGTDVATSTDNTLEVTIDNSGVVVAEKVVTSLTVGAGAGDVTVISGTTGTLPADRAFVGTVDATDATGSVVLNFANYQGAGNYSISLGNADTNETNRVLLAAAASGAAVITGGTGVDSIESGAGADIINSDAGNDTIYGRAGADVIDAGAGNDIVEGGIDADIINGGTGTNTASYSLSTAAVTVNLTSGVNTGGDAQGDILSNIQNLTGSVNGDTLTGDTAANALVGLAGNDTIVAGSGNDTIDGGADNDSINGGAGNDTVTLGTGTDTYVFATVGAPAAGTATIAEVAATVGTDTLASYVVADDVFHLSRTVFGTDIGAVGNLAAGHFALATAVGNNVTVAADSIVVVQAAADAAASIYYVDAAINAAAINVGVNAVLIGTLTAVTGTMAVGEFAVIA